MLSVPDPKRIFLKIAPVGIDLIAAFWEAYAPGSTEIPTNRVVLYFPKGTPEADVRAWANAIRPQVIGYMRQASCVHLNPLGSDDKMIAYFMQTGPPLKTP